MYHRMFVLRIDCQGNDRNFRDRNYRWQSNLRKQFPIPLKITRDGVILIGCSGLSEGLLAESPHKTQALHSEHARQYRAEVKTSLKRLGDVAIMVRPKS